MTTKIKSYEMDMCNGPLIGKMIRFTIPLMLSGMLQLLFNAADMVVVGRYAGSEALAAVGSTSSLINLLINLFVGLSVGANVLVARYYGAQQNDEVSDTVHTAITLSILSGILIGVIGIVAAKPLLELMGTPDNVISLATLYMRIYFAGMPVILLYNFGSSILRAVGDTKRPLFYLFIAGVINVFLNLFFVIAFKMSVAGVALATVISQCVSAILLIRCLMKMDSSCKLILKKLGLHKDKTLRILRTGLPAGLQGMVFSFSNVLIQSSVNSFGAIAVAGNSAASNLENFVYTGMNAFHQTALCFTGQNFGGHKWKRISKILVSCQIMVLIVGLVLGMGAFLCGHQLLGIYTTDEEVIKFGLLRMSVICTTYFLCGMMDVMVGQLRGLGYAVMPMIVSLLGACGFRILWICTVFQMNRTLLTLYYSYPISWGITAFVHFICYLIVWNKIKKKFQVKV